MSEEVAQMEIDRLAKYLMQHWSHEIRADDGAVSVSIRLLEELREGQTDKPEP